MTRSRKPQVAAPSEDAAPSLASKLAHLLRFDAFTEWGLGVQIVEPTNWDVRGSVSKLNAWGHLSQSGSVALVLPGAHPKILALLLNMVDNTDTHRIAWAVLRMLEDHSAPDGLSLGA